MKMQSASKAILLLLIAFIVTIKGEVQNCTSAPCNLQTCQSTSSQCKQVCSAAPCATSCQSPAGCVSSCPVGGCSEMTCNVADSSNVPAPICSLECKKNCLKMDCISKLCYPICSEDNCKMTCTSAAKDAQCYPKCYGKNCEINCKGVHCEASCTGGGCTVKFSKITEGVLSCPGGNCNMICAIGKYCDISNNCTTCTKKYVDDPFPNSAYKTVFTSTHVILFSIISAVICMLL